MPQKITWPYSRSFRIWNFIFCSGQIAIDPKTMELIKWWIEPETRQVCRNIGAVLKEYHLWLKDVVKTTIFLKNIDNYELVNSIYKDYFILKPARTVLEVSKLLSWALIQIEAIAHIK